MSTLLPLAGIASFKAFCPPSPGREPPVSSARPAFLASLDLGSVRTDLEGVQGVAVVRSPPSPSRCLLSTPPTWPTSLNESALYVSKGGEIAEVPATTASTPGQPWESGGSTIPLRTCQILMPSSGADNDALRVKAGGRKLRPGMLMPLKSPAVDNTLTPLESIDIGNQMRHAASEPLLASTVARQGMSAATSTWQSPTWHSSVATTGAWSDGQEHGLNERTMASTRPMTSTTGAWHPWQEHGLHKRSMTPTTWSPRPRSMAATTGAWHPREPPLQSGPHTWPHSSSPWVDSNARLTPKLGRSYSQVGMEYPGLCPPLRPWSPLPIHPMLSRKTPKNLKRVTFRSSKNLPSSRNAHDMAKVAAEKSKSMQAALFNLRRAGRPETPERDEQPASAASPSRSKSPPRKSAKSKTWSPSPSQKSNKSLAPASDAPPPTCAFSYSWEEHSGTPIKERVLQELTQRHLPPEEAEQRYSAVDSMGIEIDLNAGLFEKRFPLAVTLKIAPPHDAEEELEQMKKEAEDAADEHEKAQKELQHMKEKELTVMVATLNGTHDTSREVHVVLEGLEELQRPVMESGGSRHATAIVAFRTLLVVRRKHELLKTVEGRKTIFEKEAALREKIFQDVTANTAPCPEGLLNIRHFVTKHMHKPEDHPADADRSNFEHFASTFGMPRRHTYNEEMMELAKQTVIWWVLETLELAMNDGESEQIKRHMDVVNGIGAAKEVYEEIAEHIKRCMDIMGDRLAERCLKVAQNLRDKDRQVAERSKEAQPTSAKDAAIAVNDEIRRAVSLGAPNKHPKLLEAKTIATALESEEKARYGYRALLAAQKIQAKDEFEAIAFEKAEGVPPVGPASIFADKIDKEIKAAIKDGAPPTNEFIMEATQISKSLRDEDGIRKRKVNRFKRLSTAPPGGVASG